MKKIFLLICLLTTASLVRASDDVLDSLKQKLKSTKNDTLKGAICTQIAGEYLKFDTIVNRNVRNYYQTEAIHWSLTALQNYSYYEDTLGMRRSFDDLAKVYVAQHKYSQAKWFLLQSTNISRKRKDAESTISALVKLAGIKMDNKETKLALRDLNEALNLSLKAKSPKMEALVQQTYVYLYNRLDDSEKSESAAKRVTELNDQIRKAEEAQALAASMPKDSTAVKKPALTQKKKAYAVKKNNKPVSVIAKKVTSNSKAKTLAISIPKDSVSKKTAVVKKPKVLVVKPDSMSVTQPDTLMAAKTDSTTEARTLAATVNKDSISVKKADSIKKKKAYTDKKTTRAISSSAKKLASL
ncbi:MAG: hypothetical protein JKY70_11780 [Mucilaginibacter sp.]|nr:hypothetical protein [Mucilaginibacter sp.]